MNSRLWLLPLVLGVAACSSGGNGIVTDDPGDGEVLDMHSLRVDESGIRALAVAGDRLRVEIPVTAEGDVLQVLDGNLRVTNLRGELVGEVLGLDRVTGEAGVVGERGALDGVGLQGEDGTVTFELAPSFALPASTSEAGALADLVLDYEILSGETRVYGHRSLFTAWQKQAVRVFSTNEFAVGGESIVRVIASDPATGAPLADADVAVGFHDDDGNFIQVASGLTDAFGTAAVPVRAEEDLVGNRELVVEVATGSSVETIAAPVEVAREQRILVTTDKPLYQPGQTIHFRTLAVGQRDLHPVANAPLLLEVTDAEGNKVGRLELETDDFGVAAGDFTLAQELNMGTWNIAATVGDVTAERAVTVSRYVLPKFNIVARSDAEYYRPGDTATFTIDAQYFFGQSVSEGAVLVEPYTFDVGFNPLPTIEATLNEEGVAVVEVPIPDFLVGLPLEQGDTFVRVDVSVTDATDHTQTVTRNLAISNADAVVTVIPSTALVPGHPGRLHVLTADPVGRPLAAAIEARLGARTVTATTDERGIGVLEVPVPTGASTLDFTVTAETEGGTVNRSLSFPIGANALHGAIAITTDASLYEVGESIEYEIVTAAAAPRVFVDVIRGGQTLRTETVELTNGRASGTLLDLGADMTGTLQIDAYLITRDAQIVRGDTLVWVDDADTLEVALTTPLDVYRPGEDARIDVSVTDENGAGVVAAVGVTVVDEAVFALQDARPGLERIYFQLEEELLNPAYNLYGLSFEDVLAPPAESTPETREAAASVLLAATDTAGYPIAIETYQTARNQAQSVSSAGFGTAVEKVRLRFHALVDGGTIDAASMENAREAREVLEGFSAPYDAWGQRLRLELETYSDEYVNGVNVRSAGLDEEWGTEDDLTRYMSTWELTYTDEQRARDDDGPWAGADAGDWGMADAATGPPIDSPDPSEGNGGGDGEGGNQPRVRSYFPETLLVQPSVITDSDGRATIPMTVADSITSWRMTGTANTQDGRLGSGTGNVVVFQDFFVDINFPVSLTQNDRVSVPVALFNYLETPQTVTLRVDEEASGDWFTLLSDPSMDVDLGPGEVTVRYFDVQVDRVGWRAFQVTAIGSEESDAVRRVVEIVPDGQEQLVVHSDRLVADVERTITIPAEAIDEASSLFVRLYPGLFSQLIEGLDSLLQMPSGCFEQTSSTTYPNVLVMQYLLASGQSSPELEMLATEYIAQGYQRLVSYEVPGGGFEWFGNDPAHRILSAYGLLEFSDMAEVFAVDPAVITRTRNWLLSQQEGDGRWQAASEGIHEGATNNFQDSDVRATAYIAYALLESGDTSAATMRGVDWVRANLDGVDDAYSLGLVANMLLAADPRDSLGLEILGELDDAKIAEETESGTVYHWESESQSLYYGSGEAMNMETTAFILQAFIRASYAPSTIEGVVGYLIQNKGEFGQFSSTQATIHSLRAFTMLLETATESGAAEIDVFIDDVLVDSISVNATNSDLMRQFDLRDYVQEGDNTVRIAIDGEGEFLYQIVGRYYLPWELVDASPSEEIVTIDVAYDRTELAVNETVNVTTTVTNHSDARLDMVMVDLGVPPGFDVRMSDFDAYIADEAHPISRVERAGRQLTLYLYGLDAGEVMTIEHALEATMPLEASTPPSAVWLYYDDEVRTEAAPVVLTVL